MNQWPPRPRNEGRVLDRAARIGLGVTLLAAVALALVLVISASSHRDLPPGDGPGHNGKLIYVTICGTTLYSGPDPPGGVAPPIPPVLGPPVIIRLVAGCDHGRHYSIEPAGLFTVTATAVAKDGLPVAIYIKVLSIPPRGVSTALLKVNGEPAQTTKLQVTVR